MKRVLVGLILSAFLITAIAVQAEAQGSEKNAQKSEKTAHKSRKKARSSRKSRKSKSKTPEQAPVSATISPTLGDIKWGSSPEVVRQVLIDRIHERYRKPLAKATDAIEEDRLTTMQNREIEKLRDSYTEFDGQTSGWDLGFLRDEFTHNNGEAMLVYKDSNSQNYYFFIKNRLWKWYKAFDIKVFEGRPFATFAKAIQGKFGDGKEVTGELAPGEGNRHWLEWQDEQTRLRAIDQTSFFGFYGLVFEDKNTLGQLASLRRNASGRGGKTHAVVEAVTSSSAMTANPDESPNIVDRITGKLRSTETAEEEGGQKGQNSRSFKSEPKRDKSIKDELEF